MLVDFRSRAFICKLVLLLTVSISISAQVPQAWQSFGNFTDENITFIRSTINNAMAQLTNTMDWPKYISDKLNAAWDPAWNVALVYINGDLTLHQTADFRNVMYGYAYNQHWLWYNKFKVAQNKMMSTNQFYSFIIWKDYNCHTWVTQRHFDAFNPSIIKSVIKYAIIKIATDQPTLYNDPWLFAFKAVSAIEKLFPQEAYTILVFKEGGGFSIQSCMVKDVDNGVQNVYDTGIFTGNTKFAYTIMRMR